METSSVSCSVLVLDKAQDHEKGKVVAWFEQRILMKLVSSYGRWNIEQAV